MTPTKAEPLYDRMVHAFGKRQIEDEIRQLMSTWGDRDPLQLLTDEARDVLLTRLISHFKFTRKINAANRKLRNAS